MEVLHNWFCDLDQQIYHIIWTHYHIIVMTHIPTLGTAVVTQEMFIIACKSPFYKLTHFAVPG